MKLLVHLLLASAAPADSPCTVRTNAGWVASLDRVGVGTSQPTRTNAQGATRPLQRADVLCEGDLIRNPRGSGIVVRMNFGGQLSSLSPGESPHRVTRPNWLSRNFARLQNILGALGSYRQDRRALAPTGVRGPNRGCIVSLSARNRGANYVLADVPVRFAWRCPPGEHGQRAAIVVADGRTQSFNLSADVFAIDVARDCPTSCIVTITSTSSRIILEATLVRIGRDQLPSSFARLSLDDAAVAAAAGVQLVESERPWRLLGASLIWRSACAVPPAAVAAAAIYGVEDPEIFCDDDAGFAAPE